MHINYMKLIIILLIHQFVFVLLILFKRLIIMIRQEEKISFKIFIIILKFLSVILLNIFHLYP